METKQLPDPRIARKKAGLTWEDLAHLVGCSVATVARCERNSRYPATRAIRKAYLKALGLKVVA